MLWLDDADFLRHKKLTKPRRNQIVIELKMASTENTRVCADLPAILAKQGLVNEKRWYNAV